MACLAEKQTASKPRPTRVTLDKRSFHKSLVAFNYGAQTLHA